VSGNAVWFIRAAAPVALAPVGFGDVPCRLKRSTHRPRIVPLCRAGEGIVYRAAETAFFFVHAGNGSRAVSRATACAPLCMTPKRRSWAALPEVRSQVRL